MDPRQPDDFAEELELDTIRGVAEFGDRSTVGDVDAARRQDRAGIDAAIDQMHRAPHGRSFEARPLRHVHPPESGQEAHMRVKDSITILRIYEPGTPPLRSSLTLVASIGGINQR
jgi:hypothetical protein